MTNVQDFGAAGDGRRDDTDALTHAIADGEGLVELPRGDYRITRTIEIDTNKSGRFALRGTGGTAKIVMAGAGPALRIVGTHEGTADPQDMKPAVWRSERMPTIADLEIEGAHNGADGIELSGTVQPVIRNVGLHQLRHGIRLTKRNRNVIIEGCQVYHNTGVGVFFDGVNLHQINIIGNHISYNRLGGVRIERSEVRNLQITGNDIEYNNNRSHDIADEPTAEIYIDCTAANATVNEVTIASNTIQATPSPGGCNLRIIEDGKSPGRPPGLYAITGNVIGSQTSNVHLSGCYGITLTGNNIYSASKYNLLLDGGCRQIIVGSNQFRRHTPDMGTGVRVEDSSDCIINGCHLLDESEAAQASGVSLLELIRSQCITVSGCQFIDGWPFGVDVLDCSDVSFTGCALVNRRDEQAKSSPIRWRGKGEGNLLANCRITGTEENIRRQFGELVQQSGNVFGGS